MKKVIAFALCLCLLVGMLPIAAFAIEDEKGNAGGVTLDKEDAFPAIRDAFAEYLVNEVHIDKDPVLGIPVDLYVYAKVGKGSETAPVVQYVINTNTERLGTESDVSILTDMIEEYIIVVVDYHNNSLTSAVNTDMSTHQIQWSTVAGTYLVYKDESGATKKLNIIKQCDNWILPAGYRLMRDVPYFNYKENGVEGTLERIVQIWNEDFSVSSYKSNVISWGQKTTEDGRLVFNDANGVRCYENSEKNGYVYDNGSLVSGEVVPEYKKLRDGRSYVDATARTAKVTDTWAEDWWDCVKPDGTPVDLNLYYDIMYPSQPESGVEIPVLAMAVSRQSTTGNWYSTSDNPEYLGAALFDGYAVLLYEYAYIPMARKDHYGYFADSPLFEGTNNVDWKYGLSLWNGMRSSRAAIRGFRYECVTNPALSAINENAIGLICISKTGYNVFLGNENPDIIPEQRIFFEGQDESQPQPHLTYPDGTPIPSGVQAMYTVSGAAPENMTEGFCPVYVSVGKQDAGAYSGYYKNVRLNAKRLDIESVHYALPLLGHAYLVGMDEEYNVDTYLSVMNFFDYHVAGRKGAIEYITPLSGSTNVGTTDTITVKFNASVALSTVLDKVKIVNAKTGEEATGSWSSLYGNTEWRFMPDGLDGGATYLVYVPEDTLTEDGRTMKESKTAAFITVPEEKALAGTVTAANGVKTVTDQNKVFFIFERPETADSTSETLRFSVTNEQAAQMLSVYALSEIDTEDPKASVLGEKIGSVAIAGAGSYEMDITEYLASVPSAKTVGFALVGERTVGTTTLHHETYDTASSEATLKGNSTHSINIVWSDLYDQNGTSGGSLALTKTGSSYYFNNALGFGNNATSGKITESDLGRLFRIRMSVLVPEKVSIQNYFKVCVAYNNPAKTGIEQYVDWEDTTFTVVHPGITPGEWVDIDFYYHVDDPTYTAQNIQKCYLSTSGNNGLIYIDNYIVEEIVTGVEISNSIRPSIVTHPSMKVDTTLLDAIMAKSGSAGDIYFGGSEGLILSSQSVNMSTYQGEKVYLKLNLENFDPTAPSLLTLNVAKNRYGRIGIYGITDKTLGESWSAESISWQNAPANDRFGSGVDPMLTTYIQTVDIIGVGTYTVDLSEFCHEMVDKGAKTATVVLLLEGTPGELILSTNFEGGKSGDIAPSASGGTPVHTISETFAYPDGGTYAYEALANATHSRIHFSMGSEKLTEADIGKKFTIKYHFYSEHGGTYKHCMRPASTELQSEPITVEAGVWTEQTYTFTVTEEMVGIAPKFTFVANKLGSLTGTEGAFNSRFFVDNIRMYDGSGNISFTITEEAGAIRKPLVEADFDNSTTALSFSGNAKAYIGAGPDSIAYSGTKTMYWTATGATQRPMLKIFDTITEDMVGQQYEITYMFYSTSTGYFNAYPRMVPKIDGASKTYEFRSSANPAKITYAEAGKWQKVTTVFTVTQEMYDLTFYENGNLRIAFEPYGLDASEANPVTCYVDDLRVYSLAEDEKEETVTPYIYKNGFEDKANSTEGGFEYPQHGSQTIVVDTDDRRTGGEGSLKILANRSYNRLLLYKIIDDIGYVTSKDGTAVDASWIDGATTGCLTEDDIGRKFRVSFYIKSEIAGKIDLAIANRKGQQISVPKESYEIPGGYQWTKITYEITVNEAMITNRQASLVIFFADFSYSSDGTTLRTMYIDDFSSTEIINGYGAALSVAESAVISNRALTTGEEDLWVDSASSYEISYEDIHAALVTFAPDSYLNANEATLKIKLEKYSGQQIKVYGLMNQPIEGATYNDIPALNTDGTINSIAVFGGAPIATFTADREQINVSITEYVRARDKQPLVLLFVSEDSNTVKYLQLDFDHSFAALGKDITSDANLSFANGKLSTTGTTITFDNLIDFSGTPLTEGQAYTVKLTVSAESERDFTLTLDGSNFNVTKTLQNGKLVVEFVADKADLTTITLTSSVAGFAIDDFELAIIGTNTVIGEIDMDLMIAEMHEDLSVINGALANMTLAEDATLSLYFPEEVVNTLASLSLNGTEVSLSTLGIKDTYRVLKITGIAAKDLAKYHTITFNYKSGVSRTVDVSAMEYLARLIESDEANVELRRLVVALVDYAREAQRYFLGKSALPYEIMYTALLDEYARYATLPDTLGAAPEIGAAGAVITDAAIHLAHAPEYLFRISESFSGTVTLTQGASTESYIVENGLVDGKNVIVFRPSGVYAAANTVTVTTEGTTNSVGSYGLATYRSAALSANLSQVVNVVDALACYVQAARIYKSTLTE